LEGLHTLNSDTFKHKLLAWVNIVEHHNFCFFHVQHKIVGTSLIVVTIPPLILTSERNHLQKTTTICARLLGLVHHILYHPSALSGHPNIAQTVRG
jgi:hypothetical protein